MRKCISVSIPCYNEEDNILPLVEAIRCEFQTNLSEYDYEIHFIDNCSTDKTQQIIKEICEKDKRVKAIFNGKNFRLTSKFYGLLQTKGDCTISMVADFQDPINMITPMVKKWEDGYKVVIGVKAETKENFFMSWIRNSYYRFMNKFSRTEQIIGFNGFGLYDRKFIEFLRTVKDPMPSFRGLVSEYGLEMYKIPYSQEKRKSGKSKNRLINLYNNAIINLVSYTKIGIRVFIAFGSCMFILSCLLMLLKIISLTGCFSFFSRYGFIYFFIIWMLSVQLLFTGILGEYILEMNYRLLKRPWVIEKERINYDK